MIVAVREGNKNFQEISLLERQHSTRGCETSRLWSVATDDGLNDRVCGCDFRAQAALPQSPKSPVEEVRTTGGRDCVKTWIGAPTARSMKAWAIGPGESP